ncbi:hypothetical protein [Devosia chinhatensis]|nr:hypothetical protein [Devosia chinhatensis]
MRQQASVAHQNGLALPRGVVLLGMTALSWIGVFALWHSFTSIAAALGF